MPHIEVRLSEVLGRHRIKQRQLADEAGIRPAAIHALYHSRRRRVDLPQLMVILSALERLTGVKYGPGDVLIVVEDSTTSTTD